jgi:Transcriptional Coactivator p15 (PC4)
LDQQIRINTVEITDPGPGYKPAQAPRERLLTEPIEIAKFWKSRQNKIAIVVSLRHHEGNNLLDVREYFTDQAGCMKPSTRGLAMVVRRLPVFARALRQALETARKLDLLPEDGEGER